MLITTPIILIIFNRPRKTERIVEIVRKVKPKELFVIADGARQNNKEDILKCRASRDAIEGIDWDCEIYRNYASSNMGCSKRVSSGLDWAFEKTDRAIILEDDCIPDISFFYFCETLLKRYKDDPRVFSISGQNVQFGRNQTSFDYYFSRYAHSWGWATWRRAWQHFDYDMALWPEIKRECLLERMLGNNRYAKSWEKTFDYVLTNKNIDTWDYRWIFSCWLQSGLSIIPSVNLVRNIGADSEATHTAQRNKYNSQESRSVTLPLRHPPYVSRDLVADEFTQRTLFHYHPTVLEKIVRKMTSLIKA